MASFTGYLAPDGAAGDIQALCTSLEAQPNILTAEAVGGEEEASPTEASTNTVKILVTTEDPTTKDWAGLVNDVGNLDASQTDVTYDGGSGTKPTVPFVIIIDSERMKVTADSGTVFTVVRAFGGTSAAAHNNDVAIATSILEADIVTAGTAVGNLATALGY